MTAHPDAANATHARATHDPIRLRSRPGLARPGRLPTADVPSLATGSVRERTDFPSSTPAPDTACCSCSPRRLRSTPPSWPGSTRAGGAATRRLSARAFKICAPATRPSSRRSGTGPARSDNGVPLAIMASRYRPDRWRSWCQPAKLPSGCSPGRAGVATCSRGDECGGSSRTSRSNSSRSRPMSRLPSWVR